VRESGYNFAQTASLDFVAEILSPSGLVGLHVMYLKYVFLRFFSQAHSFNVTFPGLIYPRKPSRIWLERHNQNNFEVNTSGNTKPVKFG